jgi:F-type H+-transporting ATPase subunit delta
MASAVANRYARALVDIVLAAGSTLKPEEAVAQLRAADEMVTQSTELRTALLTPAIPNSRKRAVMGKLMEEISAARTIRNFIYVVIDHRRMGILSEIREAFEVALDERLGFARADVSSAMPLDERRGEMLAAELSALTGRRMRLRFSVDPELLGGVTARIGSKVYDGSVRGQLQQLRRQLTEESAE